MSTKSELLMSIYEPIHLHLKLKKVAGKMPVNVETNTYRFVKEVKLENLEGIGPLKAFPCSLLHSPLFNIVCKP